MPEAHYSVNASCTNCGAQGRVQVLVGNLLSTIRCALCGCQTLKHRSPARPRREPSK